MEPIDTNSTYGKNEIRDCNINSAYPLEITGDNMADIHLETMDILMVFQVACRKCPWKTTYRYVQDAVDASLDHECEE